MLDPFLMLADTVNDLVYVWKTTGEMVWVNRAFKRETGMTVDDFGFRNADNPFVHPEDLPAVLAAMEAFVGSTESVSAPIPNRFFDAWGQIRPIVSVVHKITWQGEPALLLVSRLEGEPSSRDASDYRTLVETADDGILKLTADGRIVYSNRCMHGLANLPAVELNKRRLSDLFVESSRAAVQGAVAAAASGTSASVTARLVGDRLMDVRLSPLESPDRTTVVLAIARDITDVQRAERAERALETSERRLSLAIHGTADAIWEWNLETQDTYFNPRWYEMLGFPGEVFPMTFETWKSLCHPDDFRSVGARIKASLAAERGAGHVAEFRVRTKGGAYRWMLARGAVVERDAGGRPRLLAGTVSDITERKHAEETLADNQRRLQFLTDNVPTVMLYQVEISPGGTRRFNYVSAGVATLHGLTPEQVLADASTLYSQIHEADITRVTAAEAASMREGSPFAVEVRFKPDRWGLLRSSPRIQPDGSTIWDGVEIDITETKRQEEEHTRLEESLRQAQKMESMGRLAGGVAHDFNNMLTAIMGNVAMAQDDLPADSSVRELLHDAIQAAQSAEALTRQLLAFSRKQVVTPKILSLNDVAQRIHKMLARVLGEDIHLKLELGPDLGTARVDPGQVEQMLVNLAVNARDAMPDGGALTIATSNLTVDAAQAHLLQVEPGPFVMIAVSDTGTGMTPEVKARLFEPFFTTKGVGKGTGLGLAIVYGAVKQNAGAIEVRSEVGRGSVFEIYFPRTERPPQSTAAPPPRATTHGSETILVVEDEPAVRKLARTVLERHGYRVFAFENPADALATTEKMPERIDLLLTDLVMPGLNGRELAERIVALRPNIRVIYTSGYTEDMAAHRGIAEQRVPYLAKPYSVQQLTECVREVLDGAG